MTKPARTRVPRAHETIWAQEAAQSWKDRPPEEFRYPGHDHMPNGDVVYLIDQSGVCEAVDAAVVATEHWRVQRAKAVGTLPRECSSEIPAAPARPIKAHRAVQMVPVGSEGFREVEERYRSGGPGMARDNFDVMTDQAMRRQGPPPFTAAEVAAGRAYRALHERVQSAGVKCSAAFDVQAGGGGGADFMDAYIRDVQRLALFHDAIGAVIAKDMRRVSADVAERVIVSDDMLSPLKKRIITVRALVDAVCLHEETLSGVLERHGWSVAGKNRNTLCAALCAALWRMQGI